MDIRCPKCGEAVDAIELNFAAEDIEQHEGIPYDIAYKRISADWQVKGCLALGYLHAERPNKGAADIAAALHDLLGDDIDGIASELSDAEYFGLI